MMHGSQVTYSWHLHSQHPLLEPQHLLTALQAFDQPVLLGRNSCKEVADMLAGLCMHEGDAGHGERPLPNVGSTLVLVRQQSIDFIDGIHLSMHGCLRPSYWPCQKSREHGYSVHPHASRSLLCKHCNSVGNKDDIGRSQTAHVCGKVPLTFLVSFVRLLPVAMTLPFLTMTHLSSTQFLSHHVEGIECMHRSAWQSCSYPMGTSPRARACLAYNQHVEVSQQQLNVNDKGACWARPGAHLNECL